MPKLFKDDPPGTGEALGLELGVRQPVSREGGVGKFEATCLDFPEKLRKRKKILNIWTNILFES